MAEVWEIQQKFNCEDITKKRHWCPWRNFSTGTNNKAGVDVKNNVIIKVGVYAAKAYRPTISIIARCVIPEAFHLECRPYEWTYTFCVVIAYRLRHIILECTVTVW